MDIPKTIIIVILSACFTSFGYARTYNDEQTKSITRELNKADQHTRQGRHLTAIVSLERLNAAYPDDSQILAKLAYTKIALSGFDQDGNFKITGHSKEAISHLEKAVQIEPDNLDYKIVYAHLLHDHNKSTQAKDIFSELLQYEEIRAGEKTRNMVINYVLLLRESGDIDGGLVELLKSLKVTDYDSRIFSAYIAQLSLAKQYNKMLTEYAKFESEKGFSDSIKYKVCMELLASKQFKQSDTCYQQMLSEHDVNEYFRNRATIDLKYVQEQLGKS